MLALSGSINCVKHLQAIATEAEVDVDVYRLFADYADKIPLLAAIRPNGPGLIEELEAAGGARAVLKRLERFLDLDARGVTGERLGDVLADVTVADDRVIRTVDAPLSTRPSIVIVRGSLLPGGGIVRLGGTGERTLKFRGNANIFHSRDEALAAIKDGKVKPGDVVMLRGLGVIGGPAHGADLGRRVRARRREAHRQGRDDHRGPALGPRERRARRRRGVARGGGRRPARVRRERRHDLDRRDAQGRSISRCPRPCSRSG